MIKIIKGNLLDSTEDIICHQVNCQGVMGSGVAKAIREKWPVVYERYQRYCNIHTPRQIMGTVQYVEVGEGGRDPIIANMFSQNLYGYDGNRYTSYDLFYRCLEDIQYSPRDYSIAFPYKIGSDRGGASWNVIYAMICDVLGDRDVTIYKLDYAEEWVVSMRPTWTGRDTV